MSSYTDKKQKNSNQSNANQASQNQTGDSATFQFEDNRPRVAIQRKLQEIADNNSMLNQLKTFQFVAHNYSAQRKNTPLNPGLKTQLPLKSTQPNNKLAPIQRQMPQVNRLLGRYAKLTGNNSPAMAGPYPNWAQLQNAIEGRIFSQNQVNKLMSAFNDFDAAGNRIGGYKDRSGNQVVATDQTDPTNLDVNNPTQRPKEILDALNVGGTHTSVPHFQIFNLLCNRIQTNLGPNTLIQFWKGAHIVFKDGGTVYNQLKVLGNPIAARNNDGSIKTKTEFAGKFSLNARGWLADPTEQRRGSMMIRRPGGFQETSHYPNTEGGQPQYGVDLPEALGGHLLFGLTPDSDTFVQTEGAGFQNFDQGFSKHLKGFFTVKGLAQMPLPAVKYSNITGWKYLPSIPYIGKRWIGSPKGTQTGIAGYSKHSEAEGVHTEIREHDNGNFERFLASIQ